MLTCIQDLLKPMQINKGNLSLSILVYSSPTSLNHPEAKKYMVVALEYILSLLFLLQMNGRKVAS
jgi:hypothetical protein